MDESPWSSALCNGCEINRRLARTGQRHAAETVESSQSRSQAGQRVHLRLIESQRPRLALQTAQAKDGWPFVDAHQAAPHQSLQRR